MSVTLSPPRLAWFSPVPPSPSGIAAYTAELVPLLRARNLAIDVFDVPAPAATPLDGVLPAHDFVWRHRRQPYDLIVYQLGNAACHDHMWSYLFRYPGLVVLHDAQVHQARAQALLGGWTPRRDDYLAEFVANHPGAPPDLGLLIAAGLGGSLFGHWPHVRLVLQAARLAAVHSPALAARLAATYGVDVRTVSMGVADPLDDSSRRAALQSRRGGGAEAPPSLTPAAVRARHGVPEDAVVVGAYGGLTPEKRLPQVLEAVAALARRRPELHVLLVGAPAAHYDALAEAEARGIAGRVHVTGFVADQELPAYLQAADICACLRWPTNGETSASWLRAVAAARATIVTELAHQADVPTATPRGSHAEAGAIAVGIPILDEVEALRVALDELAGDAAWRRRLGQAARAWWQAHHTLPRMADAYTALVAEAMTRPAPRPAVPAHLRPEGDERLRELLAPFGQAMPAGVAAT